MKGITLRILRAELGPASGAEPGVILEAETRGLLVACGQGTSLRLLELQPEGRRRMSAAEFLRGHRLGPGERAL
jgi:methionyl-tRNA formyltransferase